MSPILAVLSQMRRRPLAIFLGEKSITKLAAYLRGYEHAVEDLTGVPEQFLRQFCEWIELRLQDRMNGWENAILRKSKDEADAVDHFWRLLDEFVTANPEPNSRSKAATAAAVLNQIAQRSPIDSGSR